MSKTYKDRPYWVRVNDPKSSRYESHNHLVTIPEKVGEEVTYKTKFNWRTGDLEITDEVERVYGLYHYNHVVVPCSIDKPEQSPNSSWRRRFYRHATPEERIAEKCCHYHLNYDCDYVSGAKWKHLTNRAIRSNVRQQLHEALIYQMDWDSVDIWLDTKYASRGWWD